MQALTGHERIANILKRQLVDRIGIFEHYWNDPQRTWTGQAHLQRDRNAAIFHHHTLHDTKEK